jgi:Lrp/AsnC family leucine-responsive transcriptional regulator
MPDSGTGDHALSCVLDRFDIALLNLVQANARATADELSTIVPLSASAIARRLRRLRRNGAIAADIAMLGPAIEADRLLAIVQVQLHDHSPTGKFMRLRDRLIAAVEVQLLVEVSGTFDLMLVVAARDFDEFNAFVDGFLGSDPAVQRYETAFVKRKHKLAPIVPLDERDLHAPPTRQTRR